MVEATLLAMPGGHPGALRYIELEHVKKTLGPDGVRIAIGVRRLNTFSFKRFSFSPLSVAAACSSNAPRKRHAKSIEFDNIKVFYHPYVAQQSSSSRERLELLYRSPWRFCKRLH
jgi:hypothetical protein